LRGSLTARRQDLSESSYNLGIIAPDLFGRLVYPQPLLLLVVRRHWVETVAGASAISRWPPALLSSISAGASPAARGMETAVDCPAAKIVSNRETAAYSVAPCWVVTTTWKPSGSAT
jgi:hypothetical protein